MVRFASKTVMARIDGDLFEQLRKAAEADGTSIADASRTLARRVKSKPDLVRRNWTIC